WLSPTEAYSVRRDRPRRGLEILGVIERGESKPGSLRRPSAMGPTLITAAVAPVVDPECQSSTGYEAHM
ncbi:hypothetical protein THAOC_23075, partial [Thalassiosira oceanica]